MRDLRTARLLLRPWRPADAEALLDLYSRWEVARYLGPTPRVMETPEQARRAIERWSAPGEDPCGVWAVVPHATGRPVGTVLLKVLPLSGEVHRAQPSDEVEVGWHLHPDARGHGYATEAAAAVLEHAFGAGLAAVYAVTYPENGPSQAVCRRLGMEPLGPTGRYYNITSELFRATAPGSPQQFTEAG